AVAKSANAKNNFLIIVCVLDLQIFLRYKENIFSDTAVLLLHQNEKIAPEGEKTRMKKSARPR
ncbi:MAG: hypothetical protein IKK27_10225, partial [Alistipes sp.]|nr:hypothetical protein [Alistipes sp.]